MRDSVRKLNIFDYRHGRACHAHPRIDQRTVCAAWMSVQGPGMTKEEYGPMQI